MYTGAKVRFEFFPLRFEFVAAESLFFPPGKAANVLRGALGVIFRRIACVPQCREARMCELRESCHYARFFEPSATGAGPSGLADWPRPFVFSARHLDGRTVSAGESFHFDVHVFSLEREVLAYLVLTFAALVRDGLGPRRGKAELRRVVRTGADDLPERAIYENSAQIVGDSVAPVSLDLAPLASAPDRIRVEFLSPTELKHEHRIASRPEFPILFGRIRDRLSTLRKLYGPGPLEVDFQGSGKRSAEVRMTRCDLRRQDSERRSSRTGERHSIGGFVGVADYEGDLGEFLPYLEAGRWVGVGRQVVWGKGEIGVEY
jgi:CRISPR-associated endoribonuclease Cas6